MTDEISREGKQGDNEALVGNVYAHAACKNAVRSRAGLAAHDIRLGALKTKRESREAVGNEVYPKKMNRLKDNKAAQCCDEDAHNLAHVGREQELNRLADVVVDAATFFDGAYYCCKVIVCKNHIGYIFGNVGAGDAHANAYIGGLD